MTVVESLQDTLNNAVLQLVNMLKDLEPSSCLAAAAAIENLAQHGEWLVFRNC
jgi:hypothetical protein